MRSLVILLLLSSPALADVLLTVSAEYHVPGEWTDDYSVSIASPGGSALVSGLSEVDEGATFTVTDAGLLSDLSTVSFGFESAVHELTAAELVTELHEQPVAVYPQVDSLAGYTLGHWTIHVAGLYPSLSGSVPFANSRIEYALHGAPIAPVPEPASWMLLAMGMIWLVRRSGR